MSGAPIFLVLTAEGLALARRLAAAFAGAEIHGLRGRAEGADRLFEETAPHLRVLFKGRRPIVGVCAAGVLIRAVAPLLADKRAEPPVVALAEDGAAVVPLLGGHRGANELARRIGDLLGVGPAVTTAGDRRFGVTLDDPPAGWRLGNPHDYKTFMAELLSGHKVRLVGEAAWLTASALPFDAAGSLTIRVTLKADAGSQREPPLRAQSSSCLRSRLVCHRSSGSFARQRSTT